MEIWSDYQKHGILPRAGGWGEQPLVLIVLFHALGVFAETWKDYRDEEFDWNKFSATQQKTIEWVERGA